MLVAAGQTQLRFSFRSPMEAKVQSTYLRFLLFCSLVIPMAAQSSTQTPSLQQAIPFMQSGDWVNAEKVLEPLTKVSPTDARAWLWYGLALMGQKKADEALQAFAKASQFPQTETQAFVNLGRANSLKGDKDAAFEWLRKARANKANWMQFERLPELASLLEDPRFEEFRPKPSDFEPPFVESVRVIQEWKGEAAGDQFGWIARDAGDIDGDGVHDAVTSAPSKDVGGPGAGRVYVYSSKSGKLLWERSGKKGDQLGLGIEAAGDVNRDGTPDVVAGAPGAGKAYVFSGKDGATLHTFEAEDPGDVFGRKVSDVGDYNDDGYADVLVGAPKNDAGGQDAGRAYVYSGRDGALLLTLTGESAGDQFGSSGAGFCDAKHKFIVVGAPGAGPKKQGRTYVYSGPKGELKFTIDADPSGVALGSMFVSVVGDLDADGVPDVYASDWSDSSAGPSTGRVYLHSGADGHRLFELSGEAAGDGFGIGPADAGDVDKDGHDDLIVGAWQHAGAAASGGKVYLYSGKDGTLKRGITCRVPGDTFGFDATGIGDVDGDGTIDFLLTSAWSSINGFRSGRMFIVSGR